MVLNQYRKHYHIVHFLAKWLTYVLPRTPSVTFYPSFTLFTLYETANRNMHYIFREQISVYALKMLTLKLRKINIKVLFSACRIACNMLTNCMKSETMNRLFIALLIVPTASFSCGYFLVSYTLIYG